MMTLYALRPAPGTGSLDEAEVVDQSSYGWRFLEQAITLWRLVDKARADELEAIKERSSLAAGDGEIRFYEPDLRELVRLLTGTEDALVAAGIVDHHWRVPADQLEVLARRVPDMDLETARPIESKTSALAEIMVNAISLRNFLADAASSGCVVAFG